MAADRHFLIGAPIARDLDVHVLLGAGHLGAARHGTDVDWEELPQITPRTGDPLRGEGCPRPPCTMVFFLMINAMQPEVDSGAVTPAPLPHE